MPDSTHSDAVQTHFRTCNLCEAMCGLEIKHRGDEILSIVGDRADEFSRGHICPKAVALKDIHTDPDRLRHPVRRTADGWERISWDEAFDEVARNLNRIQKEHGRDAVAMYAGNPNVHNYGSILFGPLLTRALRTKNNYSATSVDQLPHHFAGYFMLGHQLMLPIPDIDRTDFFLNMGGNPVVSNGSLMTAPDVADRLKDIQARGGKVVVVDPRRTETAAVADKHLFIRPGTDVFLLLALLNVIFAENLERPGRLAEFTDGIDRLRSLSAEFTPEAVASVTGIEADSIRELARDFAAAERAVCYGRIGLSTQEFGAACQWLVNALNIVTGNFDRPGGAMFTRPAFDVVGITGFTGQKGSFGRRKSRVRGCPEVGGEFPVAVLAEEILTPGEGKIRALVTSAGNPVLSTPNGRRLDEALASLDFMVSVDFYINETTRHAHIILPPTASLEHENYDVVFHVLAIRNTAKYTPALFEPAPDTRHDWEIFLELMTRLDASAATPKKEAARLKRWLLKRVGPEFVLDWGLRMGPYGMRNPKHKLTLKKLKNAPHGIDLGPLEPCLPKRLFSASKRIDAAPEILVGDVERIRRRLAELDAATANGNREFLLIGRRHLRSNNSWMHNYTRLVRGKDRCTLLVNPDDAATLGVGTGQTVRVSSRVQTVEAKVEVTADMMRGTVSLPHGWGHDREGVRLETARRHAGVSLNDLTDDARIDALSGNAALCGTPVRIAPVVSEA